MTCVARTLLRSAASYAMRTLPAVSSNLPRAFIRSYSTFEPDIPMDREMFFEIVRAVERSKDSGETTFTRNIRSWNHLLPHQKASILKVRKSLLNAPSFTVSFNEAGGSTSTVKVYERSASCHLCFS